MAIELVLMGKGMHSSRLLAAGLARYPLVPACSLLFLT
jgi:hypothetical protein